ncbi:class I SAM-dependent methyltransferase [Kribbella catacumbae]|uniref:class I SAM-dependent methyltransferase n=1 Tax=Kribbella catacumbae TaxID=460086 RepID=UPI000370625B|nr:methyltransferase domain-containing protein [Kribbella catacumbae]
MRATAAATIGRYLSRQAAKPHGAVGKLMARNWLSETAAVNDTAVELLHPEPGERICEVGFGPGRTLSLLAAAGADVVGVEVSPAMVAMAGRRNAGSVAAGRMRLHQGDGTTLPVADDSLDAVIGVHTIYFWPVPVATLAEVVRALRSGGRLVLAFRDGDHPVPVRFDPAVYHVPTTAEARDWLHRAGFTDVGVERRPHIAAGVVWVTATTP